MHTFLRYVWIDNEALVEVLVSADDGIGNCSQNLGEGLLLLIAPTLELGVLFGKSRQRFKDPCSVLGVVLDKVDCS